MSLAVSRSGAGPDLVLVHGWGLGPRVWDGVQASAARCFTVHTVALPGYAGSAPDADASLATLADRVADATPAGATLCGWSLGAMIALTCAARHPDRVGRLALIGANACFVARPDWPEALPPTQLDDFAASLAADPAALLKHFCRLINVGDTRGREAIRALAPCLADGLPADPASLRGGLELLRQADLRAPAREVRLPTLLLHGEADPLMPAAGARRLAALMPRARCEVDAEAAHGPFLARPEALVDRLRHFAAESP